MFSRNTWRTRKRHKSKEAMCLSAPYKIDFLTKLQSTVEQYRTKQQNEKEEGGRKRNAQWDYHTKIDSQPNWRHIQMRSMSSQWVFWLCGYSSIIEFDDSFFFWLHVNRIGYVVLRSVERIARRNSITSCVRSISMCASIEKQNARIHMNMYAMLLSVLYSNRKNGCVDSFICLGMHKNTHVLPIF